MFLPKTPPRLMVLQAVKLLPSFTDRKICLLQIICVLATPVSRRQGCIPFTYILPVWSHYAEKDGHSYKQMDD